MTVSGGFWATLIGAAKDATIKNIKFEDVDVTGTYAAAVVGYAEATTIENVQVLSGSIDASYSASGIGGYVISGSTVDGCTNNVDLTGPNRAGGICGNFAGTMTNCVNNGDVVSTGSGAAGGMIGIASAAITVENCTNNGDVATTADNVNASAAGILGQAPSSKAYTITSCVNNGDITAEQSHAAGIAVSLYGGITAIECENTGAVQGADGAAGIVPAKAPYGTPGTNTETDCTNTGTVKKIFPGLF